MSSVDPELAKSAPSWSKGGAFIFQVFLGGVVGVLLASTPIVDAFLGNDRLEAKLQNLEGKYEGMQSSLSHALEANGDLRSRIALLEKERAESEAKIKNLENQMGVKDKQIQKLQDKNDELVERITSLKLQDGNPASFK